MEPCSPSCSRVQNKLLKTHKALLSPHNIFNYKWSVNKPCLIYQYSNMAPRLSGKISS